MNVKAYIWGDEYNGESDIVWATTPGKAKALLDAEYEVEFTELRVKRLPWADKYGDIKRIPAEEFLIRGWWLHCSNCGIPVYKETAVLTDTDVLCAKCGKGDIK